MCKQYEPKCVIQALMHGNTPICHVYAPLKSFGPAPQTEVSNCSSTAT